MSKVKLLSPMSGDPRTEDPEFVLPCHGHDGIIPTSTVAAVSTFVLFLFKASVATVATPAIPATLTTETVTIVAVVAEAATAAVAAAPATKAVIPDEVAAALAAALFAALTAMDCNT
jgi:hypothetical protein